MKRTPGDVREIVALCCARSLKDGVAGDGVVAREDGMVVRQATLPCSSKVEVPHLLRLLEAGADGVEVVACPDGKCQFLVGNVRAQRRVEYVRRLLDAAGMGGERVGASRAHDLTLSGLVGAAKKRYEEVRKLEPNPMKGGVEQ